ncbi:MAG TPA: M23 family metallopeptidase [Bacillota bacterium]|nr:M23 family metallopeptidase [Bacillota bacterium]
MGKHIIRLFVFLALFIAVSGIISLQKEYVIPESIDEVEKVELSPEPEPEIMFSDLEILPGGFFVIYLKGITDRDEILLYTTLTQDKPRFFSYSEGKLAIAGISCRTKEGEYTCRVQVQRDGYIAAEREGILKVLPKEFEKQYLKVTAAQKSQRSNENFNEDRVHTERARAETWEKPLWEGVFLQPAEGRISTEFGMIRYINNEESERHSGLDISAARGTPVKAANSGVIRLSMMLKVTGNTIIIDHGSNIYTSYAHLDKLLAEEGTEVRKGDIIGEVGSTGFSTGPHLHWSATIGKTYINPESLMEKDPLEFIDAAQ